ncbi:transcription factor bHLH25 [Spinacia oleracea]|uniref:Transcription factor bHLH25 n=1 Tax=Spinacia oleracea TaxID=3562 RepID=A0A9R0KBN6_SPIOL|nr:transcription factor bHLH25-like [Spinacia oleracea]
MMAIIHPFIDNKTSTNIARVKKILLTDRVTGNKSSFYDKEPIPEINAPDISVRFVDDNVLMTILCEIQHGLVTKIVTEITNSHLFITNMNSMPIVGNISQVSFVARMESDFRMSKEDLTSVLHSIFE